MKYNKEEVQEAKRVLQKYKGIKIYALINRVSKSGMSRRIEFYVAPSEGNIDRVGWLIARITGHSYAVDKGGLRVDGCGMDMIYHVLTVFNSVMAREAGEEDPHSVRNYSNFFFNANDYRRL